MSRLAELDKTRSMQARRVTLVALAAVFAACEPGPEDGSGLGYEQYAVKTVCPSSGTLTTGIDVSKWQGTIDWAAVKNGGKVKFAIARASDGLNYVDAKFAPNFKGILAQGLVRGVYQYFEPAQNAVQQADLMLQMIKDAGGLLPGDLPPVLDLEATGGQTPATIQQKALAWLQHVEAKTGKKPIVYTAAYFSQANIGAALKAYPVWIANYKYTTTNACPLMPDSAWSQWRIWQYSDKGSVAGISGGVDMNVFDGTLAELQAFAAGSGGSTVGGGPKLTMKIAVQSIGEQPRDSCKLYQSEGIFDWQAGQSTEVHIDVTNNGPGVAQDVTTGLWIEEPYLRARSWSIYSDHGGSFQLNDTDGLQKIARDAPGQTFDLWLGAFSAGETKRIVLKVDAVEASLGLADHPDVRAWVKHLDSWYDKASFDSAPQNVDQSQTFNGGDLRVFAQTDVLGTETCDDGRDNDCNGVVDDGCGTESDTGAGTSEAGVVAPPDAGGGADLTVSEPLPSPRPLEGCSVGATSQPCLGLAGLLLLLLAAMLSRRRRWGRR